MQTSTPDPPGGWWQVGLAFWHDVTMAGFLLVPPVIYARMAPELAVSPHTIAAVLPFTRDLFAVLFMLPAARLMERLGVKRCTVMGTALACVVAVVMTASTSFALFVALQARAQSARARHCG